MSNNYHMVMAEEFFGVVKRGAFDHWKGEVIPVRGPNREIIGEAKVVDVDHREDGHVYVVVESQLDLNYTRLNGIAKTIRGGDYAPMSFRFQPKRDDDVARWLKNHRDFFVSRACTVSWPLSGLLYEALDDLLDEYRARADYGLTLDADLSELPDGY